MPTIKFTDTTDSIHENYAPFPAKQAIPEWLKNLSPYRDGTHQVQSDPDNYKVKSNTTARKCVPVMDAVMAGYVIPLPHDIHIEEHIDGSLFYRWPNGLGIEIHPEWQFATHSRGNDGMPKLLNPWGIETPAGYSCLFTAPLNEDNPALIPFSGVVETDTFLHNVNFPFMVREGFTGTVPAGTPFVQVIPFKREGWDSEIAYGETDRIRKSLNLATSTFRHAYRSMFWKRKEYN
jgi:hypothetical protein